MSSETFFPRLRLVVGIVVIASTLAPCALAADHYALLVSGASGGGEFAARYDLWRSSIASSLLTRFGHEPDRVLQLAEMPDEGVRQATAENVRLALGDLRRRAGEDDVVLIILMGHGTATDLDDARFNLVGRDLTVTEWAELVRPIAARVVFINGASGSYAFLPSLAARGRVIVTANDAVAEQSETMLPEFLLGALVAENADIDKNGKLSIWEAFAFASRGIREWFEENRHLPTERPLLDDTGKGVGREAETPGPDGILAQTTYIDSDRPVHAASEGDRALLERRAAVESQMQQLRARKGELASAEYDAELEKLLLEFAQIDRELRK